MRYRRLAVSCLALGLLALELGGCSHASVQTTSLYQGAVLARPDVIYVRDFVVTPTDVALDSGRIARLRRLVSGSNDTQQEATAATAVVESLSNELVSEIGKMGLPVQRLAANVEIPADQRAVLIDGNILSIDEGNRAKRVVVGFGAGASKVEASLALDYLAPQTAEQPLARFHASGNSGDAPGMLATGGAGAAVGAGSTIAVSGASQGIRETQGATVTSDADNISKKIADQLRPIFVKQGWITAQ